MYLLTQVHIRSRLLNRLLALPIGDMMIIPCVWASQHRRREGPNSNLCPFFLILQVYYTSNILQMRQSPLERCYAVASFGCIICDRKKRCLQP